MSVVWVSFVHDGEKTPVGFWDALCPCGVQLEGRGWMYLAKQGRGAAWRDALAQIAAGACPRIALREVVEGLPFDVRYVVLPAAPPVALWDLLPPCVSVYVFDGGELRRVFAP